jgi:hypothetical protein
VMQAKKLESPKALRLGDPPKANFEHTVLVMENGCVKPQVVGYGVGK